MYEPRDTEMGVTPRQQAVGPAPFATRLAQLYTLANSRL
jgi:hypothetical protein